FLVGGVFSGAPDPEAFRRVLLPILDAFAASGYATVRAYGEMVDVLVQHENPEGAVALEQLWNDLIRERGLRLACGYRLDRFSRSSAASVFDALCEAHTSVALDAPEGDG